MNPRPEEQLQILRGRYTRLANIAQQVVDEAESVGTPEHPRCAVEPHLIRTLMREIYGEPQPSAFATMSAS